MACPSWPYQKPHLDSGEFGVGQDSRLDHPSRANPDIRHVCRRAHPRALGVHRVFHRVMPYSSQQTECFSKASVQFFRYSSRRKVGVVDLVVQPRSCCFLQRSVNMPTCW